MKQLAKLQIGVLSQLDDFFDIGKSSDYFWKGVYINLLYRIFVPDKVNSIFINQYRDWVRNGNENIPNLHIG